MAGKYASAKDPGISAGLPFFAFLCFSLAQAYIAPAHGRKIVDRTRSGISNVPLDIDGASLGEEEDGIELMKMGILQVEPEDSGKFEGDIANDFGGKPVKEWVAEQNDPRKNAITGSYNHWDSGASNMAITRTIPYAYDSAITDRGKRIIARSMREFHEHTCIRFVLRTTQNDYIHIKAKKEGCYSYVGRMGGSQTVNLDEGCYVKGTIMHELMHAAGFFHEHSRNDRDDWIKIHWTNLKPNTANQFEKYSLNTISHLGVDYDYASIMHYRNRAFSKNGDKTISPTKPNHPDANRMGNRAGFSKKDIIKLNKLYKCPAKVVPITTVKPKTTTKKPKPTRKPKTTTRKPDLPDRPSRPASKTCKDKTWRCLFWSWSGVFDYCKKWAKVKYDICRKSCGTCEA